MGFGPTESRRPEKCLRGGRRGAILSGTSFQGDP